MCFSSFVHLHKMFPLMPIFDKTEFISLWTWCNFSRSIKTGSHAIGIFFITTLWTFWCFCQGHSEWRGRDTLRDPLLGITVVTEDRSITGWQDNITIRGTQICQIWALILVSVSFEYIYQLLFYTASPCLYFLTFKEEFSVCNVVPRSSSTKKKRLPLKMKY